ncbi:hypothetical protein [Comamonas odontotermitis]|uniref:hypothetical protein n=1 Tax=Comamonas odontotermitis TaxID=379895 RepID=UPI001CC6324A|nr:hypothetical protein [Comamonas odontotermitis]UBB18327.1 hypothetical protein LAD35_06730 [Comamonas odontotermitis]
MEHTNAPYLRALASGQQVLVKPPYDDEFIPLFDASSTALAALLRPSTIVNPGIWEFKVKGIEDDE